MILKMLGLKLKEEKKNEKEKNFLLELPLAIVYTRQLKKNNFLKIKMYENVMN